MFNDTQLVNGRTVAATRLTTGPRRVWRNGYIPEVVKTWLILLFDIFPSPNAQRDGDHFDQQKLSRVKGVLETMSLFFNGARRRGYEDQRPMLWCSAEPLRWMKPDDYVPSEVRPEEIPYQRIEDRFGCLVHDFWIIYIPGAALNNIVKGAFFGVSKTAAPADQPYDTNPDVGLLDGCLGRRIFDIQPLESNWINEYLPRSIYVLCPDFWTALAPDGEPVPLTAETRPVLGKVKLDDMQPKWLELYGKILWGKYLGSDRPRDSIPEYKPTLLPQSTTWRDFHYKDFWTASHGRQCSSVWQCALLAWFDEALPLATSVNRYEAPSNVASYGWYILAVYLSLISRDAEWDLGIPIAIPEPEPDESDEDDLQTRAYDISNRTLQNLSAASYARSWEMHLPDTTHSNPIDTLKALGPENLYLDDLVLDDLGLDGSEDGRWEGAIVGREL